MALPNISTVAITELSLNGFTVRINLINMGDTPVTDVGAVWGTKPSPALADGWRISRGGMSEPGEDYLQYPGDAIQPDTDYYVRAYAVNGSGTAYGNQLTFKIAKSLPVVRTIGVYDIVPGKSYSGQIVNTSTPGFSYKIAVDNLGDKAVTEYGIVWGTSPSPTLNDWYDGHGTKSKPGEKKARLAATITDGVTYYVRAYATNSLGTSYGDEMAFTPSSKYEWEFVATPDHGQLESLGDDDHKQYLNIDRHSSVDLHVLGETVPHDIHSRLQGLDRDDHLQYLTAERHNLKSMHPLGTVVPYAEPVTNGNPDNPELVFDDEGDLVVGEVDF